MINLRFETGVYDFDLVNIDLRIGGENTVTTIVEYKSKNKDKDKNNEMNSTTNDSKLNQSKLSKIDLKLNREEEKSSKNLKMEDIFFEKCGKQNASLNTLPTFEDVFDIHEYELNFKHSIPQLNLFNTKSASRAVNYEKFVAYEMGTTANIMLIKNGVIYIAIVGDSLSVIYKNKKAYNLNKEHQLILKDEKERVTKSGQLLMGIE